jgi:hypothetical protein
MDQITDEERRRIAELVAAGAPSWKPHQEIGRSRYATAGRPPTMNAVTRTWPSG